MLTWSLGCTGFFDPISPPSISMARFEITSLAFMFDCVPDPVCHTTSGKWSMSFKSATSAAACCIAFPTSLSCTCTQLCPLSNIQHRGGRFTESKAHIYRRCCTLQYSEGSYNGWWHPILWLIDLEVLQRALRLRAPVPIRGNMNFTEGICFGSSGLCSRSTLAIRLNGNHVGKGE